MNVRKLRPRPVDRVVFSYGGLLGLKPGSGCYVLTSSAGKVRYIGQATDVRRRLEQHLADEEKGRAQRQGKLTWAYVEKCEVEELSEMETAWVRQHQLAEGGLLPPLNKIEPPSS